MKKLEKVQEGSILEDSDKSRIELPKVQECDATEADSSTKARQKICTVFFRLFYRVQYLPLNP